MWVTRNCKICGTEFTKAVKNSPTHGLFCSVKCRVLGVKAAPKKQEQRHCKQCGKGFWFRMCYAKRPGSPGSFCSNSCRASARYYFGGNPQPRGDGSYGTKRKQHAKQLERYQLARTQALEKLGRLWQTAVACINCGCDYLPVLQVNHRSVFKSRQCGAPLWRKVIKMPDVEVKEAFDIRCQVCNWAYHHQKENGLMYQILWKGRQ